MFAASFADAANCESKIDANTDMLKMYLFVFIIVFAVGNGIQISLKPNVKLSRPDKAGANLEKVSCRKESPQPGRAAGKGWLQRLVRNRSSVVPKIVYSTA